MWRLHAKVPHDEDKGRQVKAPAPTAFQPRAALVKGTLAGGTPMEGSGDSDGGHSPEQVEGAMEAPCAWEGTIKR